MHAITVLVQVPHQVHSVSLGCLWYFTCYYAKEVLHFLPNRGWALHQTRFLLESW